MKRRTLDYAHSKYTTIVLFYPYDNHQAYFKYGCVPYSIYIIYINILFFGSHTCHFHFVWVYVYMCIWFVIKSTRALRRIGQKWPFLFYSLDFCCDIRSGSVMLILYKCSIQSFLWSHWNLDAWTSLNVWNISRGLITIDYLFDIAIRRPKFVYLLFYAKHKCENL